jgi:hypothetical protein
VPSIVTRSSRRLVYALGMAARDLRIVAAIKRARRRRTEEEHEVIWSYLESLNLSQRFERVSVGAPQDDKATGIRRGHFIDPSGILWHFSHAAK